LLIASACCSLIARAPGLLAAKYFELRCAGDIGSTRAKMKSVTKREIAILVAVFVAMPFAL
jgi:hypothetical protein